MALGTVLLFVAAALMVWAPWPFDVLGAIVAVAALMPLAEAIAERREP